MVTNYGVPGRHCTKQGTPHAFGHATACYAMLQNVCEAGDDLMWEVIQEQDLRFKDTLDSHDVDPTDALTAEVIGHAPVLPATPQELSTETTTKVGKLVVKVTQQY